MLLFPPLRPPPSPPAPLLNLPNPPRRFLSQPFQVAEVFTGHLGKLVPLKDTIAGFNAIRAGEYDHLPEVAFYMLVVT